MDKPREDQFYAIIACLNGSWLWDCLHDISDYHKDRVIAEFIAYYGKTALEEAMTHVSDGFSVRTTPKFLRR